MRGRLLYTRAKRSAPDPEPPPARLRTASVASRAARRPLRTQPHRAAPPRQPAHRAAGLAVRALGRRALPAADRGPRPESLARELDRAPARRPARAGDRLGRRAGAPERARRAIRGGGRAVAF